MVTASLHLSLPLSLPLSLSPSISPCCLSLPASLSFHLPLPLPLSLSLSLSPSLPPPLHACLRYRYTVEELYGMLRGIQARSDAYTNWCSRVDHVLDSVGTNKAGNIHLYNVHVIYYTCTCTCMCTSTISINNFIHVSPPLSLCLSLSLLSDLSYLRDLLEEGNDKHFTQCPTYDELRDTIKVCVACVLFISQRVGTCARQLCMHVQSCVCIHVLYMYIAYTCSAYSMYMYSIYNVHEH